MALKTGNKLLVFFVNIIIRQFFSLILPFNNFNIIKANSLVSSDGE
jgi:hypothetical protein